ncbi:MAG TPA: HAD family hydrolase [Tepidisphaeraceae bacterium]|jgi:phosphoglycolate phosphatase
MLSPLPKAVLFDMDGTLTSDCLQWDHLRADLGVKVDEAILEAIHRMNASDRAHAEAILHKHEYESACRSELAPCCHELLQWLDARGIGRALITRNTRASVNAVFDRHGLHFDVAITREDGEYKPSPQPLWHACQCLGIEPADAWMVGDWKYDIEAANNAAVESVWLRLGRSERSFYAEPKRVVNDLQELFDLLKSLTK